MRVPEIGCAIYVILKRMVSEVLEVSSNPSHTTSRVSPATQASYMGSFVLGPVRDFWLLREKCPWDSCLGGISNSHWSEELSPT